MQNQYNNYLKRQKQQPINNFKEKVRNSLNGKTVNNTTMPNTTQAKIQNKVKAMTPTTGTSTNTIGSGSASGVVTPVQISNNINAKPIIPNASQTPLNASEGTPVITTPVEANQTQPVNSEGVGGAGLMSLSDVNSSLAVTPEAISGYSVNPKARTASANSNQRSLVYNPLDPNAIVPGTGGMTQAEYEAEAKRKQEAGIALDNPELYNKYVNQSTPYKLAEQILQSQKEQADKGWQLQEQMFQQQQEALNKQYEQSKLEAENAYKQAVDTLNEQKYNQMEELNISGTNRGIQYSPQQLGLENVANINHNKNLVETSNKRNELLNKLQIEMNNSLAQLNMSHLQNYNDYQNKLNSYQVDYYEKLMNWNREDNKTEDERAWEQKLLEEKRKWEEAQAQKDKEFQQMMQELQNKFDKEQQDSQNSWQSGENALDRDHQSNESALDREHDKTLANMGRSGGGYSGYSRGYSRGYSGYSRSYNPYSRGYYGGYQNYDGGMPEVSSAYLEDEIAQQAVDNNFKRLSTDAYNAVDSGGVYDLMERAGFYDEFTSPMYNAYYGLNNTVDERLNNTRETALKHLINKSVARSTNGAYNIGDTVYQHRSPLRQSYIDEVNRTKERTKAKVMNRFSNDNFAQMKQNYKANTDKMYNEIMDKNYKSKYASTEKKENKTVKRPNKITTKYQTASERVKSSAKNKSTTKIPKKPSTEKKKYQTSVQKVSSAKNSSKKTTTKKTATKKVDFKSSAKKTTSSSSKKKYTTSVQKVTSNNKKTTTKKKSFLDKVKKKLFKK